MAYMDLIRKLEKRLGFRELPETPQVQFNNARQTPEHWADIFDVFRSDIGGITSGLFICLTTACWYMCISGKYLNAVRD
jgi:hypothetical protein